MAKDNHIGIVYVLSNRAMPGLVKIGMTTRPELDTRLKELYTTGVPVPFDVEYACEVKASDCNKIEKALHSEESYVLLQRWINQPGRFQAASRHESKRERLVCEKSTNNPVAEDRDAVHRSVYQTQGQYSETVAPGP